MKNFNHPAEELGGRIDGMRIPDDDMQGWIQTLMEAGFSETERDSMLANLNKTYRDLKIPFAKQVEQRLEAIEEACKREHKYYINDDQRERLRKIIEFKLQNG